MKNNSIHYCIGILLMGLSLLSDCSSKKADDQKFELKINGSVPIRGQAKGTIIFDPGADDSKLRFKWLAKHGKFQPEQTTEASSVYTAPDQAVTDEITVTILKDGKTHDTASNTIVVGGAIAISGQATPAGEQSQPATQSTKPVSVDTSNSTPLDSLYFPAGWMGDAERSRKFVQVNDKWRENPHSDPTCYKWTYTPGGQGWAAIAWQYPENNFGSQPGRNLTGYSKVTVWLRGEKGGETLILKAGGHTERGAHNPATFEAIPVTATLTREWQKFEIKLSGNLSNIPTAFVWVANDSVTFFLDDLQLEK